MSHYLRGDGLNALTPPPAAKDIGSVSSQPTPSPIGEPMMASLSGLPGIIRSPRMLFLGTLERIEEQKAPVTNPVDVVRWNMTKRYLGRLWDQGFPVIPTRYLKTWNQDQVMAVANELGSRTLVVKPVMGASAGGVFRLRLTSSGTMEISAKDTEAIAPAELSTIYEGQEVLIQPLIESVISEGEYSLFYFRGRYSHAICKSPRDGDFRVQEEHGGTNRPVDPSGEMVDLGVSVVSAVGGTKLLYARVDVIRGRGGQWQVMELELIEPSLYLDMDPESPERFADAIDEWLGEEANGRV